MKSWFDRLFSDERRKDERRSALPLVAYYWDGSAPTPRRVRDISAAGMYLLTEQRWYPNTLIKMTLTRSDKPENDPRRSIVVTARVVRSEADGVGLAFLLSKSRDARNYEGLMPEEADRKSLLEFLARLQGDIEHAVTKFLSLVSSIRRSIFSTIHFEGPEFGWRFPAKRGAFQHTRQV